MPGFAPMNASLLRRRAVGVELAIRVASVGSGDNRSVVRGGLRGRRRPAAIADSVSKQARILCFNVLLPKPLMLLRAPRHLAGTSMRTGAAKAERSTAVSNEPPSAAKPCRKCRRSMAASQIYYCIHTVAVPGRQQAKNSQCLRDRCITAAGHRLRATQGRRLRGARDCRHRTTTWGSDFQQGRCGRRSLRNDADASDFDRHREDRDQKFGGQFGSGQANRSEHFIGQEGSLAFLGSMFGAEPRGCSVGHARHPALLRHDSPLEGAGSNSRFPVRRNGGSDAMGRGGPIKSL